ncbi:MAG: hypothetical protein U0228_30720 [Myxococcaceae bacterium]
MAKGAVNDVTLTYLDDGRVEYRRTGRDAGGTDFPPAQSGPRRADSPPNMPKLVLGMPFD